MSAIGSFVDYSDSLEVAAAVKTDLGEGPIWDDTADSLVFVDSNHGQIYRLNPNHDQISHITVGNTIGVAIPRTGGGYVASSVDGLLSVDEKSGDAALIVPIEKNLPNNRMNDGKCDARGRLWSGTFSIRFERNAGTLYRIDPDLTVTPAAGDIRVSNGLGWSPDNRLMYFNDTLSGGIDVFDYDLENGRLSNHRRFAEISRDMGLPDGLAVDADGCVWVALFNGGQVRRYSPDGTWIGVVRLPAARVTSCNFGGTDLDDLYITTANFMLHDDGNPHEAEAGFLFRCRPGIKGLPSHKFAG